MKTVLSLLSALLGIPAVFSKQIQFDSCKQQELEKITSVDVTPCDEELCVLKRGNNETVTIKLTLHQVITAAKIYAYAIFGLVPVPLPLQDPDACEGQENTGERWFHADCGAKDVFY